MAQQPNDGIVITVKSSTAVNRDSRAEGEQVEGKRREHEEAARGESEAG